MHLFTNKLKEPLNINGLYDGQSVFLIGGGISVSYLHLNRLKESGIVTMAMNSAGHFIRPNLWVSCDPSLKQPGSIFEDPTIMKFFPTARLGGEIFDDISKSKKNKKVHQCPNVIGYKLKNVPDKWDNNFFPNDGIHYGINGKMSSSVLIPSFRILYELGFKRIYLLGVDFYKRSVRHNSYFFHSELTGRSAHGDLVISSVYDINKQFKERGVHIFNCSNYSELKGLRYVDFDEAIDREKLKLSYSIADQHNIYHANLAPKSK